MNNFVHDIMEKIANEAGTLTAFSKKTHTKQPSNTDCNKITNTRRIGQTFEYGVIESYQHV